MATERRDVEAAVHARRELGPAYEDQIVDSLLAKIDQRLEERRPAQPSARVPHRYDIRVPLVSMGIGIAAIGAANGMGGGGIAVAIVAWVAIALINIAYAFRR